MIWFLVNDDKIWFYQIYVNLNGNIVTMVSMVTQILNNKIL